MSQQSDPHETPRFTGIKTFFRLECYNENIGCLNNSKQNLGIIGIPFDGGCTFRTGARFGPEAIRSASTIIRPYNLFHEKNMFDKFNIYDCGDVNTNPFNIEKTTNMIIEQIDHKFKTFDKFLFFGGDHTISYPLIKSVNKKFGKISMIHFDSHYDTWDSYFGEKITHGTPFKRVFDEDLIDVESSMHVGIRGTVNSKEDVLMDKKLGFDTVFCYEKEEIGIKGIVNKIVDKIGDNRVYISLDIDVVDPAFAPGTGTPECGGFSSSEVISILRGLKNLNVVSADIVEVLPAHDSNNITAHLASTIGNELINIM